MIYVDLFPPPDCYPAITAWYARVSDRPAWQQVAAQEDYHSPAPNQFGKIMR